MRGLLCSAYLAFLPKTFGQQIYDVWQTTWSMSPLFEYNPSTWSSTPSFPINFVTPGTIGDADIIVTDSEVYQTMYGFGGSLTDSAALVLNNLKSQNSQNYWNILGYTFAVGDGLDAAGFNYVRVPLGASDFSAGLYSFDDTSGDTGLNDFNINAAPSYLFSVLTDIVSINPSIKIHLLPWSAPAWMKDGGTMNGGSLQTQYETVYANYLLKCLQGFQSQGFTIFAIGIQNEPENSNPTYPSATMAPDQEGRIGTTLRSLMNNNGFSGVKVIGYEHNWIDAGAYPVTLMQDAGDAFDGVSFHCYAGDYTDQAEFTSQYPDKEVLFTECTGTIGTDWWTDVKWDLSNIFIGSVNYGASTGGMWNLAGDASGGPLLPGSNSCGSPGCRPIITINSDGSYAYNQEFYSIAQTSKAVIPKDAGGPFGQRIGVSIGGDLGWALVVAAYVTDRTSSSDYLRYSLVILNWDDNSATSFDPVSVSTTIEFRGMQANIGSIPVGVTTLWWYSPATSNGPENISSSSHGNTTSSSHTSITTSHSSLSATTAVSSSKSLNGTSNIRATSTRALATATHTTSTLFSSTGTHKAQQSTQAKEGRGFTIYAETKDGANVPVGSWSWRKDHD